MRKFSVTYDIVTPESAEHSETALRGYLLEATTNLREAIALLGCAVEADSWPIDVANPPRWVTSEAVQNYRDGSSEQRSLHLDGITPSSAMRIARLLGVAE